MVVRTWIWKLLSTPLCAFLYYATSIVGQKLNSSAVAALADRDLIPGDFTVTLSPRTPGVAQTPDLLTSTLRGISVLSRQSYRSKYALQSLPRPPGSKIGIVVNPVPGTEEDFDTRYAMWGLYYCTTLISLQQDFHNENCAVYYASRGGLLAAIRYTMDPDGDNNTPIPSTAVNTTVNEESDDTRSITYDSLVDDNPKIGIKLRNFGSPIRRGNEFVATWVTLIERASITPRRDNIRQHTYRDPTVRVTITYGPSNGVEYLSYDTVTKGLALVPLAMLQKGSHLGCDFVWYEDERKVGQGSIRPDARDAGETINVD